jgi:hypothetical protein
VLGFHFSKQFDSGTAWDTETEHRKGNIKVIVGEFNYGDVCIRWE